RDGACVQPRTRDDGCGCGRRRARGRRCRACGRARCLGRRRDHRWRRPRADGARALMHCKRPVHPALIARRALAVLTVVVASAALASCGSPKPAPPGSSVLCNGTTATRVGTLQSPEITELSGLAASRAHPGVLWGHNDSGDVPRIFAIDESGRLLATVHINVPVAHDWEDIAITGTTIYIGDIGDNDADRSSILVHRVAEPALQNATVGATTFTLHYPDGAHDAETLMVDPLGKRLVIVTKVLSGQSAVYATSLEHPGALTRIATLALGPGALVTAGDISANGDA